MGRPSSWFLLSLLALVSACSSEQGPDSADVRKMERATVPARGCEPGRLRPDRLRMALTPYLGSSAVKEEYRDAARVLSEHLEIPVETRVREDYDDLVDMLLNGEVHVASLSPLAYVQAKTKMPCLQLLATQVAGGDTHYSSYFLVRKESPITSISDLEGRRVGFVSESSASGFLFPMARLIEAGLDPRPFMKPKNFLINHPAVVQAVLDGEVDAGATFYGAFRALRTKGMDTGALRVIAITGRIPFDAIVAHPDLDPQLASRIRDGFLMLNTSTDTGRRALGHQMDINGWVPTSDSFYDSVRNTLTILEKAGVASSGETAR